MGLLNDLVPMGLDHISASSGGASLAAGHLNLAPHDVRRAVVDIVDLAGPQPGLKMARDVADQDGETVQVSQNVLQTILDDLKSLETQVSQMLSSSANGDAGGNAGADPVVEDDDDECQPEELLDPVATPQGNPFPVSSRNLSRRKTNCKSTPLPGIKYNQNAAALKPEAGVATPSDPVSVSSPALGDISVATDPAASPRKATTEAAFVKFPPAEETSTAATPVANDPVEASDSALAGAAGDGKYYTVIVATSTKTLHSTEKITTVYTKTVRLSQVTPAAEEVASPEDSTPLATTPLPTPTPTASPSDTASAVVQDKNIKGPPVVGPMWNSPPRIGKTRPFFTNNTLPLPLNVPPPPVPVGPVPGGPIRPLPLPLITPIPLAVEPQEFVESQAGSNGTEATSAPPSGFRTVVTPGTTRSAETTMTG